MNQTREAVPNLEAQSRKAPNLEAQGREAQGREAQGREAQGREAQGREAQGREAQGREARVVALGEAMAVFSGAPKPLAAGASVEFSFAGAEANVCIGLARLGHRVRWLSALGQDPFGRAILKTLRGEGVDVEAVERSPAPTGVMFKLKRALSEPEVFYYRSTSAFSRLNARSFGADAWREADVLYLTGITPALSAGCCELWQTAAREAHANGAQVWLDPNYRSKLWPPAAAREAMLSILPHIHCVLPSLAEGELLCGQTEPRAIADALMAHGAANVVVKAGTRGAFWFEAHSDGPHEAHVLPFDVERVVDPIGAGDGFAAGLLSGTLDGLKPEAALRRAHAVGALVCGSEGDWEGLPERAALDAFLAGRRESRR